MIIDMQAKQLRYKRISDESDYEQGSDGDVDVVKESDITDEVRTSYNIICENGRGDDFLAVLDVCQIRPFLLAILHSSCCLI